MLIHVFLGYTCHLARTSPDASPSPSFVTTIRGSASRTRSLAGGTLRLFSSMLCCIATRVICSIIMLMMPPEQKQLVED